MIMDIKAGRQKKTLLNMIIPGILVAATGIGAGDLASAAFTGSQLGLSILWAVVVGGVFKYVLTEGLARWQLVTGLTFLEGAAKHFGKISGWLFMPYMLIWSFFVGSALISACGVTLHALFPFFNDPANGKIFFGILCSLFGLLMVRAGGFALFEKIMGICIGLMFVTVLTTAITLWPGTGAVLSGLFIPSVPDIHGQGISWTLALIGGVGGTLTILSYGYWIREKGRTDVSEITTNRVDLAAGYLATILFGLAMVIIGSTISVEGKGAALLVNLAQKLQDAIGEPGRMLFLIGAFGAVFSSLLGVWQSVPYLFTDIWQIFFKKSPIENMEASAPYNFYLLALSLIPMLGLLIGFKEVQKLYALIGSLFIPLLATALLIMNGPKQLKEFKNGLISTGILSISILFFLVLAIMSWLK